MHSYSDENRAYTFAAVNQSEPLSCFNHYNPNASVDNSQNMNTLTDQDLDTSICPNHSLCQIINIEGFIPSEAGKDFYIRNYCEAGESNWGSCSRYRTKKILNLCPDFVLPDSDFSIDEILDKLEEE